jgi:hypothetical protein
VIRVRRNLLIVFAISMLVLQCNGLLAWNVVFRTSNLATLWYYNNFASLQNASRNTYVPQSVGPIYVPVGYTNQSIYMIYIPQSAQNAKFYLYYIPFNNAGWLSQNSVLEDVFIPYSSGYAIPSMYFQGSGEYRIANGTNASSSFVLYNRSDIPPQLYGAGSNYAYVGVPHQNSTLPANLNRTILGFESALNAQQAEISKLNTSRSNTNQTAYLAHTESTQNYLVIGEAVLLVLFIISMVYYKRTKDQAELYSYRSNDYSEIDKKYQKKADSDADQGEGSELQGGNTGRYGPDAGYGSSGDEKEEGDVPGIVEK